MDNDPDPYRMTNESAAKVHRGPLPVASGLRAAGSLASPPTWLEAERLAALNQHGPTSSAEAGDMRAGTFSFSVGEDMGEKRDCFDLEFLRLCGGSGSLLTGVTAELMCFGIAMEKISSLRGPQGESDSAPKGEATSLRHSRSNRGQLRWPVPPAEMVDEWSAAAFTPLELGLKAVAGRGPARMGLLNRPSR